MKTRDLESALQKKGFIAQSAGRADDHRWYTLYVDRKKTSIRTKVSHGEKEYGKHLISKVRRQLSLDNTNFKRFIECPLNHEEYVNLLILGGHLAKE
ncbi:MAG: type II toxin-antitoxin system HicA family toxin [Planctomycetaceae bacterium]|nr:type II toxin-antitoxin system HicA family toxin [Planctomycetaceae bacterium]